jgi:hypothetical protein
MPFFLRSAQRFFIISDSRFLPSGVIPRPRGDLVFDREALVTERVLLLPSDPSSSNAAIARSRRSLSRFKSVMNLAISKMRLLMNYSIGRSPGYPLI